MKNLKKELEFVYNNYEFSDSINDDLKKYILNERLAEYTPDDFLILTDVGEKLIGVDVPTEDNSFTDNLLEDFDDLGYEESIESLLTGIVNKR